MNSESHFPASEALGLSGATGPHLVLQALDYVRGSPSSDGGAHATPPLACQKTALRKWAEGLGLLLDPDVIIPRLIRGGQEHDILEVAGRVLKVTREDIFGLTPGIDLALVASGEDARRFHLWEATPLDYLERLNLHNILVPDLNHLEGVIFQPNGDLAIVTSQPRFDIHPVTEVEIDSWFAGQRFRRVTSSGYYREEDNLGVFDAHDKNVIRAGEVLVPFDVIPCRPEGGFLRFIEDTLAAGQTLTAVRTVTTSTRLP